MLPWLLYCVLVALLIGGAAIGAEHCLRLFGKAARWVWVAALIAAVSLPAVGLAIPAAQIPLPSVIHADPASTNIASRILQLPSQALLESQTGSARLDFGIAVCWGLSSLVLLALFSWSWWRLIRETWSCSPASIGGIPVLVSAALGPAVVGIRKQTIVLPSWVLACEEDVRTLIARHELEHVRKGDQRLLLGAFLTSVRSEVPFRHNLSRSWPN